MMNGAGFQRCERVDQWSWTNAGLLDVGEQDASTGAVSSRLVHVSVSAAASNGNVAPPSPHDGTRHDSWPRECVRARRSTSPRTWP